jgi:hypothetical protein
MKMSCLSFKLQKCTPFKEFKLENCTPDFLVFVDNLKTIAVGFVGMWERLFQVIVGSVGKS